MCLILQASLSSRTSNGIPLINIALLTIFLYVRASRVLIFGVRESASSIFGALLMSAMVCLLTMFILCVAVRACCSMEIFLIARSRWQHEQNNLLDHTSRKLFGNRATCKDRRITLTLMSPEVDQVCETIQHPTYLL